MFSAPFVNGFTRDLIKSDVEADFFRLSEAEGEMLAFAVGTRVGRLRQQFAAA
jgi:hypothetical protein